MKVHIQKFVIRGLAASMLFATLPTHAFETGITRQNLNYINGGVSKEDEEEVKDRAKNYNLRFIFAEKTGDYLADVDVSLQTKGGLVVFEQTNLGPLLYLNVFSGEYVLKLSAGGETKIRNLIVKPGSSQSVVFYFNPR